MVTVEQLEDHAAIPGRRSLCESYSAKLNLDGSWELEYEYDSDRNPRAEGFLYLNSEAEWNNSVRLAKESFANLVTAYKLGTKLASGRTMEEKTAP